MPTKIPLDLDVPIHYERLMPRTMNEAFGPYSHLTLSDTDYASLALPVRRDTMRRETRVAALCVIALLGFALLALAFK
jgi:hypothetical protein